MSKNFNEYKKFFDENYKSMVQFELKHFDYLLYRSWYLFIYILFVIVILPLLILTVLIYIFNFVFEKLSDKIEVVNKKIDRYFKNTKLYKKANSTMITEILEKEMDD